MRLLIFSVCSVFSAVPQLGVGEIDDPGRVGNHEDEPGEVVLPGEVAAHGLVQGRRVHRVARQRELHGDLEERELVVVAFLKTELVLKA